jgi:hypothetical protein
MVEYHLPFGLRYRSLCRFRVGALVHCVRPRREFAPAGDQLSCVDKKVGKEATLPTRPSRCEGCLALLGLCSSRRTRYAPCGRCAQTAARSQLLRRATRAAAKPCAAQLVRRGSGTPDSARFASRWVACLFWSKASIPQPERGECSSNFCIPPVLTTSLPHYLTTSLPHYLTTSLPRCMPPFLTHHQPLLHTTNRSG